MRPDSIFPWRISLLIPCIGLLSSFSASAASQGEPWEMQPPIGVFGEEVHARGDVKLSYRIHRESFEDLMQGQDRVSGSTVAAAYPGGSIPTAFTSTSHIVELMWKPIDELTVLVTLPFIEKQLDQVEVATGQGYSLSVGGFGDVVFSALYRVHVSNGRRIHLNLGLSLPSGSTREAMTNPFSGGALERLPYLMQLGSGTLALEPGVTYNQNWKNFYWGAQMSGILQAGTNSEGYKRGNEYNLIGWLGTRMTPFWGASLRLSWLQSFDPSGEDGLLNPALSPLADTMAMGGRRLDVFLGTDVYTIGGFFRGMRLSIEAGLPVYQDLAGPQLGLDWTLNLGLQYAF